MHVNTCFALVISFAKNLNISVHKEIFYGYALTYVIHDTHFLCCAYFQWLGNLTRITKQAGLFYVKCKLIINVFFFVEIRKGRLSVFGK